jgi:hypothetical protein
MNSVPATPEEDGTVVLNLSPENVGLPNHVHAMDGWNYAIRLHKPRPEVIDKTWTPPTPQAVD